MTKRNNQSGFTLLELLIVVIIVSILAAVALPRFSKMTRRARVSEGATMLGALLTAEMVYYNENGDKFTGTVGNLLVDVPANGAANSSYDYAITSGDNTAGPVVATATGRGNAAGIIVTGTLSNDGTRQIQSN